MTRQEARRLAAMAALSAVEEHAVLNLMNRGHGDDDDDDWPKIIAALSRIEQRLRRMVDRPVAKPKARGVEWSHVIVPDDEIGENSRGDCI